MKHETLSTLIAKEFDKIKQLIKDASVHELKVFHDSKDLEKFSDMLDDLVDNELHRYYTRQ